MTNNITTTAQATDADLRATVNAFTESASTHVKRTRAIGRLLSHGLSQRGIVEAIANYTEGHTPTGFGKSSVARYAMVHSVITGDDIPELDKKQTEAVIGYIVTGISYAGKEGARILRERLAQNQGDDAVTAMRNTVQELAPNNRAALTAEPETREARPEGNTPVTAGDEDTATDAGPTITKTAADDDATAMSTLRLISELRARIGGKGFTPDATIVSALVDLISQAEEVSAVFESVIMGDNA